MNSGRFKQAAGICVFSILSLLATSALASDDGDEKCGPDGYILKFDANFGSTGRWRPTLRKCEGGGSQSSSYSSGRSRSGSSEDGDEKCGPDGYVLKFDANFGSSGRWRPTLNKCR